MKKCPKCTFEKELSEFYFNTKKEKYESWCKECTKNNINKVKQKEYRAQNKEYWKDYNLKYKQNNPKYWKDNFQNKKEQYKQSSILFKENNPNYFTDYMNVYNKERKQNDPLYKLSTNIRSLIKISFKQGYSKPSKTQQILGCTFKELKQHIESQFEPWMNWDNMGGRRIKEQNTNWDIDHIVPISSAKSEEDVIRLNHYTNLRPLCSYNNRFIKRNL